MASTHWSQLEELRAHITAQREHEAMRRRGRLQKWTRKDKGMMGKREGGRYKEEERRKKSLQNK
jgi:predicted GIY-YIG superfamily endonuclease